MMHGYGFGVGDWMTSSSSIFTGTGWMVISMMGFGLLLIVGLVVWFVWMQRDALGLNGPPASGPQTMTRTPYGTPPTGSSPSEPLEQIVRRRYANGEIDTTEYKTIIMTLEKQ